MKKLKIFSMSCLIAITAVGCKQNPIDRLIGRNADNDSHASAPILNSQLVLYTSFPEYRPGENVTIKLRNESDHRIVLTSWNWRIVNDQGVEVFLEAKHFVVAPQLEPGEAYLSNWDQRDRQGNIVPAGTYTVELDSLSVSFTITD